MCLIVLVLLTVLWKMLSDKIHPITIFYRTISLISHGAKTVARILTEILKKKMEDQLGDDQCRFR